MKLFFCKIQVYHFGYTSGNLPLFDLSAINNYKNSDGVQIVIFQLQLSLVLSKLTSLSFIKTLFVSYFK